MGEQRVDFRHDAGDRRRDDRYRFAGQVDARQRQPLVDDFADLRHAHARNRGPVEAGEHRPHQRRPVDGKLHPGLIPEERLHVGHRVDHGRPFLRDRFTFVVEHVLHIQHPLHAPGNLLGGERFGHIVASAEAHCRGRVGDAGIPGNDQHGNIGLLLTEAFEELNSIHVGHLDVQKDDCVVIFRSMHEALPRIRMGFDLEPLSREDSPTGLTHDFLVVHHEQSAFVGHGLFPHLEEWRCWAVPAFAGWIRCIARRAKQLPCHLPRGCK